MSTLVLRNGPDDLYQQLKALPPITAAEGFRRFGKGRHPTGANFGDCFSYALAIREQVPLLFKGDDFSKTDRRVADYSFA